MTAEDSPPADAGVWVRGELVDALREALAGSFAEMDPGTLRRMYGEVGAAAFALVDAVERSAAGEGEATDVSPEARAAFHVRNAHHAVHLDTSKGWVCTTCGWPDLIHDGEPLCKCGHPENDHLPTTLACGMVPCPCKRFTEKYAPVPVSDEAEAEAAWNEWREAEEFNPYSEWDVFIAGFRLARGEDA